MNISTNGYKRNSPDVNNSHNFIPSGKITMKGVDKVLALIPVKNGKLDMSRRVIAKPGDDDYDFGDVDGVYEMPYSQNGDYFTNSSYQHPRAFNVNDYLGNSQLGQNMYNPLYSPDANYFQNNNGSLSNPSQTNNDDFLTKINNYNPDKPLDTQFKGWDKEANMKRMVVGINGNNVDPNTLQKTKADETDEGYRGAGNPYGGFNIDNSAVLLGASIADKNPLGIVAGAGKVGLGLARNVFSGLGAMRRFNEGKREQDEQIAKDADERGKQWLQKGGLLLTGNAIVGNPNHPSPNAEVEAGEHLQTPDGKVVEVMGKKHSEGGELIEAPENTKVVSDYVKIGAPMAKMFKKEFGINVVAGSTFATVVDRFKKKIGLTDLLDDEVKLIERIAEQEDVKNETVQNLNLEVLSKRMQELEAKKQPMEDELAKFTTFVFEKQELKKAKEDEKFEYATGGEINPKNKFESGLTDEEKAIIKKRYPTLDVTHGAIQFEKDMGWNTPTADRFIKKFRQHHSDLYEYNLKNPRIVNNIMPSSLKGKPNPFAGRKPTTQTAKPASTTTTQTAKPATTTQTAKPATTTQTATTTKTTVDKPTSNTTSKPKPKYTEKKPFVRKEESVDRSLPTSGVNDHIFSDEAMKDYRNSNTPEREKYIADTIAGLKSDFERIERAERETGKPANIRYVERKDANPNEQAELEALRKRLSDEHRAKVNANPKEYMQEGGEMGQSDAVAMALSQFARENGISEEQLMETLSQLSEEEVQGFIQEIMSSQQPQMQEGGDIQPEQQGGDLEQLLVAYSEMKGISVEELGSQLASLPEDKLNQAVQQMQIELSGGSTNQQQGGQIEQIIIQYAKANDMNPEQLIAQLSELSDEELNDVINNMKAELGL